MEREYSSHIFLFYKSQTARNSTPGEGNLADAGSKGTCKLVLANRFLELEELLKGQFYYYKNHFELNL